MVRSNVYIDIQGREISLADLDQEERKLVSNLQARAKKYPDWNGFENYWVKTVAEFYDARGISRRDSRQTAVYKIAQDLGGRLAVAMGLARIPDYRDELEELIRTRFRTRREFCQATGLSEDMLSHVLARRKHLSVDTLEQALDRIGYVLRILPRSQETLVDRNGVQELAAKQG
jgi:hypothetical protein